MATSSSVSIRPARRKINRKIKRIRPAPVKARLPDRSGRDTPRRPDDRTYRDIFEPLDQGVLVQEAGGRIAYANEKIGVMLGYAPAELVGRLTHDLLDGADRQADLPVVDLADPAPLPGGIVDRRFRRKDDSFFWGLVSVHPLPDHDGHPPGRLMVLVTDASRFTIRFGCLTLDLTSLRVEEDGREISLTLKELLLLRHLIQHRGRVLTRAQILSEVWGAGHNGGERTVDVHLSHLRKKLPSVAKQIVSVERTGYLLKPVPARVPVRSA